MHSYFRLGDQNVQRKGKLRRHSEERDKKEWCEYIRHRYEFSTAICRSLASDIEAFVNEVRGEIERRTVVRLANEAFEQGTLFTQADFSILLNESITTIGRYIKQLLEEDIIVPTRGNRMDIGPGTSHKVKIAELYLKRYEFSYIKRNTRHSSESIARYLKEFARVAALHKEGYSLGQIRMIT